MTDATRFRAAWWWIDRWRKSTAFTDMTLAEQGAYRNLLDEAWLRGGSIPNDERTLSRACGDPVAWPELRGKVMARFRLTPEGWINDTQREVLLESSRFRESQSEKGRKGAEARWRKGDAPPEEGMARPSPGHSPGQWPTDGLPSPSPGLSQSPEPRESAGSIPPAPDGASAASAAGPPKRRTPPAESLTDLWARECPDLAQPAKPLANGVRDACLAALRRDPDLDGWRARFARVRNSAFLSGRKTDFRASLTWILGPKNCAKLDAGQYDDFETPKDQASAQPFQPPRRYLMPSDVEELEKRIAAMSPEEREAHDNEVHERGVRLRRRLRREFVAEEPGFAAGTVR